MGAVVPVLHRGDCDAATRRRPEDFRPPGAKGKKPAYGAKVREEELSYCGFYVALLCFPCGLRSVS